MDYGADPTGAISSETAFNACIASGSDCYIPRRLPRLPAVAIQRLPVLRSLGMVGSNPS